MHVLITSGPTREPIDDVRFLSNVSSGRLGVAIASAFAARGDRVTLLRGEGAMAPPAHPKIRDVEFGSAESLLVLLLELTANRAAEKVDCAGSIPDLVIHAAAVADYAPSPVEGKISSAADELVLRLLPTPKVADRLRVERPDLPIIMFKLESQITRDELIRRARRTMNRVGAKAIVANLLGEVGVSEHRAVVLRADGTSVDAPTREDIARVLVEEAREIVTSRETEAT